MGLGEGAEIQRASGSLRKGKGRKGSQRGPVNRKELRWGRRAWGETCGKGFRREWVGSVGEGLEGAGTGRDPGAGRTWSFRNC